MGYKVEQGHSDAMIVRTLSALAVAGEIAYEPDTDAPSPIVLVTMCTRTKDDVESHNYALTGQDVLLMLAALRCAAHDVFGPGFDQNAELVASLPHGEVETWLQNGAHLHELGRP